MMTLLMMITTMMMMIYDYGDNDSVVDHSNVSDVACSYDSDHTVDN